MSLQQSIELHQLSVGYMRPRHIVTKGLEATAKHSALTCLIGRNGTGKSTLLRTIACLQPAISGLVNIGGHDTARLTPDEIAHTLSIVLTKRPYADNLTVGETVALGRIPYTGFWGILSANDKAIVNVAMERVGIAHMANRRICTLSDGETQRVMIAKSLAQQTPVILLDEPTAFLDFPSKIDLLLLLRRLAHEENKTIILSTHDIETALHAADCLWLLNNDGITTGTPHDLAANGSIERYIGRSDVSLNQQTLNLTIDIN